MTFRVASHVKNSVFSVLVIPDSHCLEPGEFIPSY